MNTTSTGGSNSFCLPALDVYTLIFRAEGEDLQNQMLTISEASRYYSIGVKRLRLIAEQHIGDFAVYNGNKYLINREKFEAFLAQTTAI